MSCSPFVTYHVRQEAKTRVHWVQIYDPLGSPVLSSAMAALPIVLLLGLLLAGVSAPRAALARIIQEFGEFLGLLEHLSC